MISFFIDDFKKFIKQRYSNNKKNQSKINLKPN